MQGLSLTSAASLTAASGHKRRAKLEVQREVLIVLGAARAGQEQIAFDDLAALPIGQVARLATEQRLGISRRSGAERGTLTFHFLHRADFLAAQIGESQLAVDELGRSSVAREGWHAVDRIAIGFDLQIVP